MAVAAPATLYAVGLHRLWGRYGTGRVVTRRQARCFAGGVVATWVALVSPLDGWADRSLAAHMGQHVVLIGVAGPLFALGAPLPTALWALPAMARLVALRRWRRLVASTAGRRWMTWAVGTLVAHVWLVTAWHLPVLYDAAESNTMVHAVEHLCFTVTAVALWWTLMGLGRRVRSGWAVGALFIASLAGTGLGAAMSFAGHPWYSSYRVGRDTVSALADQQVAGVVMWAFGGLTSLVGAMWILWSWLSAPADRTRVRPLPGPAFEILDAGLGPASKQTPR